MGIFDLAKRPVLPVIQLQKVSNPAQYYTFNHFTGAYDFRLTRWDIRPPVDSVGGRAIINITDLYENMSSLDALMANIDGGYEILVWLGKTDAAKKKLARYFIEKIKIHEDKKYDFYTVTLEGPDVGSAIMKNRYVQGNWEQKKDSDGITLLDDPNVAIEQIATDLLTKTDYYSEPDFTAQDQGIIVNAANINAGGKQLAQFDTIDDTLDSALTALDRSFGGAHWVDADYNFHMQKFEAIDSQILLVDRKTDPLISTWPDAGKIGLILRGGLETSYSWEYKHPRLFGSGGDKRQLDTAASQQVTSGGSDAIDTQYLAMSFLPTFRRVENIQLYLGRTSALPVGNLFLELKEDTEVTNTRPNGTDMRIHSITPSGVDEAGSWRNFPVGADLNTKKRYWIILRKNGDATHTFKWFKTTSGSGLITATSSNGSTWTEVSGATGYACRIYYTDPLLTSFAIPEGVDATTRMFKEKFYRDPTITDEQRLQDMLISESETEFKKKNEISCLVWSPDTILETGQKVYVSKQGGRTPGKIADYMVVGSVEYLGNASVNTRTGMNYHRVGLTRFV
jgi:hypothetical protein